MQREGVIDALGHGERLALGPFVVHSNLHRSQRSRSGCKCGSEEREQAIGSGGKEARIPHVLKGLVQRAK